MNSAPQQGEPRPKQAEGGKDTHKSSPITLNQVLSVLAILAMILSAWLYLEAKFDTLTEAVHDNALKLAVVRNKVENIEGDIQRLEKSNPGTVGMIDLSP